MELNKFEKLARHEPKLFLVLAAMFLGLLVYSLSREISLGIEWADIPFIAISIVELLVPTILCVLAAWQARRGRRRWLIVTALVVCGLMFIGLCVAPVLMLVAGTLKSLLLALAIYVGVFVGFVIYVALLIITITNRQRPKTNT